MSVISNKRRGLILLAALTVPIAGGLSAQELNPAGSVPQGESAQSVLTTVEGSFPDDLTGLTAGPEIDGVISARSGNRVQITQEDGTSTVIAFGDVTEIKASGGFLGLDRDRLGADQLLNGLPVTVRTVEWGGGLAASRINLKNKDLRVASMIRNGTAQGFAEQTAATEALRGRMGDIDKYNVKATTNVNFEVGQAVLTEAAKADLCAAAAQANSTENALLLVVGYTDSTGDPEFNQTLSERRAGRVVNHLQQACGWEPYRMLTPTGMAASDPLASNDTDQGKAQNRRVAVNILVSKSVDGI